MASPSGICLTISAAEGTLNKLFSTAAPLKYVVQLTAAWAVAIGCKLNVSHIPGPENDDADAASRNDLLRFDSALRVPIDLARLLNVQPISLAFPKTAHWPQRLSGIPNV